LAWWTKRVVGLDVVQVHGRVGLTRAVREQLDRMHQLHAFADPVGDLVGIDTDRIM
jgi:hypothetical protein